GPPPRPGAGRPGHGRALPRIPALEREGGEGRGRTRRRMKMVESGEEPTPFIAPRYQELFNPQPQQDRPALKQPSPHVATKVGRNDPCPCGSGKKFKKCCMNK